MQINEEMCKTKVGAKLQEQQNGYHQNAWFFLAHSQKMVYWLQCPQNTTNMNIENSELM